MRFDIARRKKRRGFTLLEVVVALALLGMVLGSAYTISVNGFRQQDSALRDLERAVVARALLDEYSVTWPQMSTEGVYRGRWVWAITESSRPGLQPTELDRYFDFREVAVTVHRVGSENAGTTLTTVLARRSSEE